MAKEKPLKTGAAVRREIAQHPFRGNTVIAWDSAKHKIPQKGAVGRALEDALDRKEK